MKETRNSRARARPPDSGDLGRRIAYRRRELGLTRADVAARSGMEPGFVEFVETTTSPLGAGLLTRLADALGTTIDDLLGRGHDEPPGRSRANAGTTPHELDPAACWARISPGGIGRVVLTTPNGPVALPVNYRVLDATILYRTAAGGLPADVADQQVAFEVDRLDEVFGTGWSVLVSGTASVVFDEDALHRFEEHADPEPWAAGERDTWVRIRPARVSGRTVERPTGAPPVDRG
ncbi:pyridoxamine 5'-phosphate oxidase family protein [Kitasatospora sp. A2-31]|uniref:helix-turn-helix domain-containing protein n=1 Tax=Kitasatospora sp. A2-31 TaxID=2916414 RepID=UPI001EEC33E9|nr:pyridoxamine 5'-phosphate oxidase family protein [Kitasatospora sp. A2-31]MCG6494292.1 pyridoxamine 5'-phosphate oxidase family protein [Kitasatospora sp. A2-31]